MFVDEPAMQPRLDCGKTRARLVSKTASDTGVAATESIHYHPAGRLMRRDVNGRAAVPAGGSVYSAGFTYDAANRVDTIGVTSSIAGLADHSIQLYNGLGGLAAIQRARNGVTPVDEYATDAFGNARTHRMSNGQDQLTTLQSYTAGQLTSTADSATSNIQTGQVSTTGIKGIDTTSNRFDQQGNLVFTELLVDQQQDATFHPIVTGRGWTWNAYDPAGHLRVTQQSTWQANAQIRTVFIEHRYDALGRQVVVRTRHDLNCDPNSGVGQCLQTVEHYAWDGAQQLAELRAIVVIKTLADTGHTCVPGDDTCMPQDSTFVWTQTRAGTALEQETTSGPFAGMVRYTFAGGIDDALALWKEDGSGTFGLVPHRSWRGLYEAGSSIGPRAVDAVWPGQNRDAFFADDARLQPIEQTQWLGGLVDGKRDQSGLMYMRNRYYDPTTGRFTQEDPLGLAGGMNLYGFAGGDPVNFSDPFGLCPPCGIPMPSTTWSVGLQIAGANQLWHDGPGAFYAKVATFGMALSASPLAFAAPGEGPLVGANYAQRTYSESFSAGGSFAGMTVNEVAAGLRSGSIEASEVSVEYIVRDGNTLMLNTRSAQALERAGVPRSRWNAVNVTGDAAAEARLTAQLKRNGLTSEGTSTVKPNP